MRKGVNAPKSAQDPTNKLLDDLARTQQYETNDRMRQNYNDELDQFKEDFEDQKRAE